MDRHLFDRWLAVAERAAELPRLPGGLWHPYGRKRAMERKHWPSADVAAVGGWKDVEKSRRLALAACGRSWSGECPVIFDRQHGGLGTPTRGKA
jgi:hypothetical protein